jgi:AcrR family transcriptional regulator
MGIDMNSPRDYDMTLRSTQAAQTRTGILDALVSLVAEVPLVAVTLPRVAERAGVTVQTVLRNFGSREGLFQAGLEDGRAQVVAERTIDPDDLDASLAALVDHYERTGPMTLLLLGQETWEPIAAEVTVGGKALHRDWVERVFAHALARVTAPRDETVDLLVVATDLYAYKLLRLDRGLSRDQTLQRMRRLVSAVLDTD